MCGVLSPTIERSRVACPSKRGREPTCQKQEQGQENALSFVAAVRYKIECEEYSSILFGISLRPLQPRLLCPPNSSTRKLRNTATSANAQTCLSPPAPCPHSHTHTPHTRRRRELLRRQRRNGCSGQARTGLLSSGASLQSLARHRPRSWMPFSQKTSGSLGIRNSWRSWQMLASCRLLETGFAKGPGFLERFSHSIGC